MTPLPNGINAETILHHTTDGIYVTDLKCRILYWNKAAERITGWSAEEVIGVPCHNDVLVHVDRKGKPLCKPGLCPLHRAMASDRQSKSAVLLFAKKKDGSRVPVTVSVAPLRNKDGKVIGGVEVFRDETERIRNLRRARQIQHHVMSFEKPKGKICFETVYHPVEAIGGDYFNIRTLKNGKHAFLMADITGHGTAAALYTMALHAMWQERSPLHHQPARLFTVLNNDLENIFLGDSFCSAFMGVVDPLTGRVVYASAGHPPPLVRHKDGSLDKLEPLDMLLGTIKNQKYQQVEYELKPGELLFLFSDAAFETADPKGLAFGHDRLADLLREADPADCPGFLAKLEDNLLKHSQTVALDDDLTLMTVLNNGQ
ncbi:SpoIIE family protein phosphatase [Dethiosulfatarculus sandiegensis]|uniref:SpoIIE family protein phosphatase n=1 Tax=Dethiosulfatarculus sandiegensis TaxID=1429043 RepID=UPI000696DB0C|nr:SpoIIE family protein phosphatase [Dethiosulfatarculus sandiegensis]